MENLIFVKGRSLQPLERIDTYFNLHKGGFSIRSSDRRNPHYGKVIAYSPSVALKGCEFKVSHSGVQKIRENKRKAVCAFVRGYFLGTTGDSQKMKGVYFNPYTTTAFIEVDTKEEVKTAREVYCEGKKCFIKQ